MFGSQFANRNKYCKANVTYIICYSLPFTLPWLPLPQKRTTWIILLKNNNALLVNVQLYLWFCLIFAIIHLRRRKFEHNPGVTLPLNNHFWDAQHLPKTRLHPKQIEYDQKLHDGKNYRSSNVHCTYTLEITIKLKLVYY